LEALATPGVDLAEDLLCALRGLHEDDAAILRIASPFDEAASLHPIDDPGDARNRDVQRVREMAHRHRPGRLEERQHVEMDQADGALVPALERGDELARVPGRELGERQPNELARRFLAPGRSPSGLRALQ